MLVMIRTTQFVWAIRVSAQDMFVSQQMSEAQIFHSLREDANANRVPPNFGLRKDDTNFHVKPSNICGI